MSGREYDRNSVREELERVLSSAFFRRAQRPSALLRFLVERCLEDRESELKEAIIGVEVFGRSPDYDSKVDSIVRTEAVRLRARLAKYYAADGRNDPLIIDLPKGGYVPRFQKIDAAPEALGPTRKTLWIASSAVAIVLAFGTFAVWWVLHRNTPIPIAVTPLVNLSQDPDSGYFVDGLTDEIIRNLSIIDGLAVRSRTSSFAIGAKVRSLGEIGRELAVDYVLEGSVLTSGEKLRIDVQFIRVRDDFPVWTSKFERPVKDVIAIQDEISLAIVNNLRVTLGRGRRRYETSAEAYGSYLRGLAFGRNVKGLNDDRAITAFEEAIAKDPSFAPAYAGLAAARAYRSGLFVRDAGNESLKMRAAAEKQSSWILCWPKPTMLSGWPTLTMLTGVIPK